MNVRQIQLGSIRPDLQTPDSRAERAASGTGASGAPVDRVELSGTPAPASALPPEVQAAAAELDAPPLDPARAEDLLKRIQAGYYSHPDVLEQLATRVLDEVQGIPPAESWAAKADRQVAQQQAAAEAARSSTPPFQADEPR